MDIERVVSAEHRALLAELCGLYGIATEFTDWRGAQTVATDDTLVAVLQGLDVDASTQDSARAAIAAAHDRAWLRQLPSVVVVEQGQHKTVDVHVDSGARADVWLKLEDGREWGLAQVSNDTPDREVNGVWRGEATFSVPPDLPLGYHRLVLRSQDAEVESQLIVTPRFVGFPKAMGDKRVWGYATQFYSARSEQSWGIGDLADLADIATWVGSKHNAGYLLINPVHAPSPATPIEPSPYLPSSRRYISPLYIRVEDIPEYHDLSDAVQAQIIALKEASAGADPELLDRDASWTAKDQALRLVFAQGLRPARQMAMDDFLRKEGQTLSLWSTWCALVVRLGQDWQQWPTQYQRPYSPEISAFQKDNADEIAYFSWLQWIVDTQLSEAQKRAKDVGMPIGIINDLAVGVARSSSEAWARSDVFALGMSVGAPADAFNQHGQDWGQPPWRPDRLADLAYAPFRQMVAGALRHAGGLRVDHVMGMFRLWWLPMGAKPTQGTYVRYDHEAMVGILALEAYRAGAIVVGEDLGTVEPWVRDYLLRRGLLGTSILWFEGDESGDPLPDIEWREYCMASVTTHDLPPTAGFLAMDHVRLRDELGLLTVPVEEEIARNQEGVDRWLSELVHRGDLAEGETDVEQKVLALYRFLTHTPSRLLCVALVDAIGDRRTQNQPGTWKEYPNWQIPLSGPDGKAVVLEEIFGSARAGRLAAVMNGWKLSE